MPYRIVPMFLGEAVLFSGELLFPAPGLSSVAAGVGAAVLSLPVRSTKDHSRAVAAAMLWPG